MQHWILITSLIASLALAAQPTKRPTDEQQGETLYNRHCIQCHGEMAEGDGPATAALVKPVPNIKGKVKADEATLKIVLRGRGLMPGFDGSFDKYDARRVLRHMNSLGAPKEKTPAPTEEEEETPEEVPVDDVGNAPPVQEALPPTTP